MPLQDSAPRELIHSRDIITRGYRRADGMWDIEGQLRDTKTYAFRNSWRGEVRPGDTIHNMFLRLTVNDELVVCEVEAVTDDAPFSICHEVTPNYRRMIGTRIGGGWRRAISERLGREQGCTHLRELLGVLGATAYQTILPLLRRQEMETGEMETKGQKPMLLNTCYAWNQSSEMVHKNYPDFYVPKDKNRPAS